MKNTKFTEGKWIYSEYSPTDFGIYSDEGDGRDIALVRGNDETAEVNAKLIAAAPKLLQNLVDICKVTHPLIFKTKFKDNFNAYNALAQANNIIHEITGEIYQNL